MVVTHHLPSADEEGNILVCPQAILQQREVIRDNEQVVQVMLQWANATKDDATREDFAVIKERFPEFAV